MAGPAVLPPGDSRSKYQPTPRFLHASAQIGREILVYSGLTKEYPVEKRQHWASVVELFDPYREEWRIEKTTGEPPIPGLWIAAFASVHDDLFIYGGSDRCGGDNVVSSFHRLDTKTYHWSELAPQNDQEQPPMAKGAAAMVACGDTLALFGGKGLPQSPLQPGSSFIEESGGAGYTNEFHIYHQKKGAYNYYIYSILLSCVSPHMHTRSLNCTMTY